MPSYFYHIKFELYPTSDLAGPLRHHASLYEPQQRQQEQGQQFWTPSRDTNIFDSHLFPAHPATARHSVQPPSPAKQSPSAHNRPASASGVIDCGPSRRSQPEGAGRGGGSSNIVRLPRRVQADESTQPPPKATAALKPQTAIKDWRFGPLNIESIDMNGTPDAAEGEEGNETHGNASEGIGPRFDGPGTSTRAQFLPIETKNTNVGWGIVHFYREGQETPSLSQPPNQPPDADWDLDNYDDQDCTTLCIPSVPIFLSPADFLGFVGPKWKDDISHYRMIMTPKMNRYLVLMKARDSKRARAWREEFDGKIFNDFGPQVCHVVFIKSITFETPTAVSSDDLSGALPLSPTLSRTATSNSLKPFPPPTPDLLELPTCPVCLERMDDITGLMTIPCQHIFHCSCLQAWSGSGCPVCRHTNEGDANDYDPDDPVSRPFGSHVSNLCSVCDSTEELWICLICGNVGCGRYKGAHAKDHWKETAHCFSLEIETQHVWDYAGDTWVHRLIREKGGGKILELPANSRQMDAQSPGPDQDLVPRSKLDRMGMEYTHLLSSQLESQRAYFEEMVSKIADKASKATSGSERAGAEAQLATKRVSELGEELRVLKTETVPQLERDLERERTRATKTQDLARSLGRSLQEEKSVSKGLMARVEHMAREKDELKKSNDEFKAQVAELEETNRDLSMFISGAEKLKQMEETGALEEGELEGGSMGVTGKGRRRPRK